MEHCDGCAAPAYTIIWHGVPNMMSFDCFWLASSTPSPDSDAGCDTTRYTTMNDGDEAVASEPAIAHVLERDGD